MARTRNDWNYGGGAQASNVSFVGPWVFVEDTDSIGFIVTLPTGSGSPTGTFGVDVSNDPNAKSKADGALFQPPVAITLTAAQIAVNPPGTDTAVNFQFIFDPCPRAKWLRFKYTSSAGGSATKNLLISMEQRGV